MILGYLPVDPCIRIPLPKEKVPVLRMLTAEEEQKLCTAMDQPYTLWIKIAILTGLKQSEQFSLRWRDVDLDRMALLLPQSSTGSVVSLQLAPAMLLVLRELKRVHPASIWVFPDLRAPARPANIHAFYVGRFESAIRRAGIPRCAWRDLRHTCGARLAQEGVSVREITAVMRQREVRMAYTYRAWQPGQNPQLAASGANPARKTGPRSLCPCRFKLWPPSRRVRAGLSGSLLAHRAATGVKPVRRKCGSMSGGVGVWTMSRCMICEGPVPVILRSLGKTSP